MTELRWKQQEAGWFTSDAGGVVRERNGNWYFYPRADDGKACGRLGPFSSAGAAMRRADGEDAREEG